jgi:hypothetical protein
MSEDVFSQVAPPGFEPGSRAPKANMMDHYTTGLLSGSTWIQFLGQSLALSPHSIKNVSPAGKMYATSFVGHPSRCNNAANFEFK